MVQRASAFCGLVSRVFWRLIFGVFVVHVILELFGIRRWFNLLQLDSIEGIEVLFIQVFENVQLIFRHVIEEMFGENDADLVVLPEFDLSLVQFFKQRIVSLLKVGKALLSLNDVGKVAKVHGDGFGVGKFLRFRIALLTQHLFFVVSVRFFIFFDLGGDNQAHRGSDVVLLG